jgi:hypothetical protein
MLAAFLLLVLSATAFAQGSDEEAREHLVRGMAAIEMAKSNEELINAAEEFKKATEIAPNMAAAWYNLGSVYSKMGQLKDAIDSYRKYLTLAPQADDARKIKDDIIKLGYRLEQTEKFNVLSGMWISLDGEWAYIAADSGKLTITMNRTIFPGSSDVWMYDDQIPSPNIYDYGTPILYLESRGSKLIGVLEITKGSSMGSSGWCALPPEKNEVEGTLEKGRIFLKMKKMKFKVVMNSNDSLFASIKTRCDEVTPTGTMTREMILVGPLDKGDIGCDLTFGSGNLVVSGVKAGSPAEQAGLKAWDRITAIDGTELSLIKNNGEKIMKLRGQPGSTVQLVVHRIIKSGGLFSSPKEETINITVRRM